MSTLTRHRSMMCEQSGFVGQYLVMPRSRSKGPTSLRSTANMGSYHLVIVRCRKAPRKDCCARSGCWHKRGATVRLEGNNASCTKSRVHNVCTTNHIASPVDSTVQSSDLFSIRTPIQVKKVCISSDFAGNGPANCMACADLLLATRSESICPRTYKQL